jgi:hypothetical protein
MTAMNKRPLISESVMMTQIDIYPTEEEPDQHVVRTAFGVLRMTTIHKVPTKSKLGPCSWDEVLPPSDAWPGRYPRLPHSTTIKLPRSRECSFMK